jgi:hypothetical protein
MISGFPVRPVVPARSAPFGLGLKQTGVHDADGSLDVRFGWGLRAEIPLTSIDDVRPNSEKVYA